MASPRRFPGPVLALRTIIFRALLVFTASTVGNLTPMFYEVDGESQQMRFKALSLSARNSQIEANKKAKSEASSSAAATATNFGQQKASWLRSLRPK